MPILSFLPYFLQLIVMLLLVLGLAVGSLWLWRKFQPGLGMGTRERAVRVVDAMQLGATTRLAVVEFADKRLLIAVSRGKVDLIAEAPVPTFTMPDTDG
jgi:flagellar protein FliO/FliZ